MPAVSTTEDEDEPGTSSPSPSTTDEQGSTGMDDTPTSAAPDTTGTPGTSTGGEASGESSTGGEAGFDEEFVWVASFLRDNCVTCHANDANGNLVLPTAKIDDEEVRAALEGIEATTGLLLVEPFDRNASQTYLQITNEFGAQFPVEDTDRFGAWIDAGAPYLK
ncbi:MAG: hypothetical protein ACE37F_29980 [Nannocystaceae bacterium]|nr:hypothetical protein [bacterium]